MKLSRPGTLIIADNVVRGGAISTLTQTTNGSARGGIQGVRRFYEMLAAYVGGG